MSFSHHMTKLKRKACARPKRPPYVYRGNSAFNGGLNFNFMGLLTSFVHSSLFFFIDAYLGRCGDLGSPMLTKMTAFCHVLLEKITSLPVLFEDQLSCGKIDLQLPCDFGYRFLILLDQTDQFLTALSYAYSTFSEIFVYLR